MGTRKIPEAIVVPIIIIDESNRLRTLFNSGFLKFCSIDIILLIKYTQKLKIAKENYYPEKWMEREELFEMMKNSIIIGDREKAVELAKLSLNIEINPSDSLDYGYIPGIQAVGNLWERGEYFLPELILGAEAMKGVIDIFNPVLSMKKEKSRSLGKVIIGTVEGDIHDIGKNLVASMLTANGFDVVDLGADVSLNFFIEKAEEEKADMICMSALLTTTMMGQRKVIEILKQKGIREKYKVMVGGAPVTKQWALSIGADGTADNAALAVKIAKSFFQ